ncbi:unnamed protein product [Rhizophagus irregularis]|nr:unnamed protein product [Rhizophagus irregularis]
MNTVQLWSKNVNQRKLLWVLWKNYARCGVDSNNVPVITATFEGLDSGIDRSAYDFSIEHAYYIYVIEPIFMNGYSSDMFNTNSTYVGSNPHTMQIPYDPRNLPPSGTMVMISLTVYHGCHRDNDSELACTICG